MIIYPPGYTPATVMSENAAIRRYFEDIAKIRSNLGSPTTAQDEARRFADTLKPGPSVMERLRKLRLIDTPVPAHVQSPEVRR